MFDQDGESLQTFPVPVSTCAPHTGAQFPHPLEPAGPAEVNGRSEGLWEREAELPAFLLREPFSVRVTPHVSRAGTVLVSRALCALLDDSARRGKCQSPFGYLLSDGTVGKRWARGCSCEMRWMFFLPFAFRKDLKDRSK